MTIPFRDYEAEVYDFGTGRKINTIFGGVHEEEPFFIGQKLCFTDSVLFKNNSRRMRDCVVKEVRKISGSIYQVYVEPEKQDVPYRDISHLLNEGESGDSADWWKKV